jgi:hypothetical protein
MAQTRKAKGVHTIPEIRRTFEYMEEYVAKKLASRETTAQISKDLQKEWKKKFGKPLENRSAQAFIENARVHQHQAHGKHMKRTIRQHRGGAAPLQGAPLTDTLRAGMALAPASVPLGGHLPLSGGSPSSFGSFIDYISRGFGQPEPSGAITGKYGWPQPYADTGSNAFQKGGTRKARKAHKRTLRGGQVTSALLSQVAMRPIPSSPVPSTLQQAQRAWNGQEIS